MPTTITGQNGIVVKQNTKIAVKGCGVRIVGHKVVGNTAYLTVQTFAAGRISGKGAGLATVFRKLSKAQKKAHAEGAAVARAGAAGTRRSRSRCASASCPRRRAAELGVVRHGDASADDRLSAPPQRGGFGRPAGVRGLRSA